MEYLGYIVGAVALALAVGFLIGRFSNRHLRRDVRRLTSEVSRVETQAREQTRNVARLRNEQRSVSSLARALPNVVRELNRWDLDPRSIPGLLIQLTEAVFEPEQALLYLVRSPGDDDEEPKEVFLRAQRGLRQTPDSIRRVSIGGNSDGPDGKIGWVAAHRVDMLTDDWLNLTRTEGRSVEDNHPAMRLDMIASLVHHGKTKEHLLGVLTVGRPSVRPRDEKLMLQLIANLGALALMNTRNVRKLAGQAQRDGLTGLLNKRHFMQRLGLLINAAERGAQALGVFIFDIDHFKTYNDANGHLAGDELLKTIARVLRESLRPEDIACRYGGEEFVVAMPEADGNTAHQIAERIREAIAAHPFPHAESQPKGRLTVSGGVTTFPLDGTNSTELIGHADQALYQAKASGRNRVLRYRGVDIGDAGWEEGDGFRTYEEPQEYHGPS